MVKISAQCLLKAIGLDELRRVICKKAILKYNEYQDEIVAYIANTGPRGALIAAKLDEVFDKVDAGLQGALGSLADRGVEAAALSIKESVRLSTWRKEDNIRLFRRNLETQYTEKKQQLSKFHGGARRLDLDKKIDRTKDRMVALNTLIGEQTQREQLLGDHLPKDEKGFIPKWEAESIHLGTVLEETEATKQDGEFVLQAYDFVLKDLLPSLIFLNPFLGQEPTLEKWAPVAGQITFDGTIKHLESLLKHPANSISKLLAAGASPETSAAFKVALSEYGTSGLKMTTRQKLFAAGLLPALEEILSNIETLQKTNAGKVKDAFVVGTADAAGDELHALLHDPEDGLVVCAAVFAIIPAAIYGLHALIANEDELTRAVQQDAAVVGKAMKKRTEILLGTTYPVVDVLEGFKEAIYDLGMNLARDLILTGIMYTVNSLLALCRDDESTNSSVTPLGQISLPDFVKQSTGGAPMGSSKGFTRLASKTDLTLKDYAQLLEDLSNAFTINQLSSLFLNTAGHPLYVEVLELFRSLGYLKNTKFEEYYINEEGVYEFIKIVAKDINPSLFIDAQKAFENQKIVLLNICGTANDDLKESDLAKYMTPEELLKAMANANAARGLLLDRACENVGNALGAPISPNQLCGPGESEGGGKIDPYHKSQKFASSLAANSIFGAIENVFEIEVARVKDIFREVYNVVKPSAEGSLVPNYGPNIIPTGPDSDNYDDFKNKLQAIATTANTGYAAPKLLNAVTKMTTTPDLPGQSNFFNDFSGQITFQFDPTAYLEDASVNKQINFLYSPDSITLPPQTLLGNPASFLAYMKSFNVKGLHELATLFNPDSEYVQVMDGINPKEWPKGYWSTHAGYEMAVKVRDTKKILNRKQKGQNSPPQGAARSWFHGKCDEAAFKKLMALKEKSDAAPEGAYETLTTIGHLGPLQTLVVTNLEKYSQAKTDFANASNAFTAGALKQVGEPLTPTDYIAIVALWESYKKWRGPYDSWHKKLAGENTKPLYDAWIAYMKGDAETPFKGSMEEAEAESTATITAAKEEARKVNNDILLMQGKDVNMLLSVKKPKEGPGVHLYEYAAKKPSKIAGFRREYALYGYGTAGIPVEQADRIKDFVFDNELYMLGLNGIFKDLLVSSSRNGLFLDAQSPPGSAPPTADKRTFGDLMLNKNLPVSAAGRCFLGFMNKRVLNGQVQKLTEALNCYSPMAVDKNATNLSYIKTSLDCIVRTIIIKESMKTLFVYGFMSLDQLYAGNNKELQPFFSVYVKEEILRSLKRQFSQTSAAAGVDNFYADIVDEFITGLMRIVYQDESMTSERALQILIADQVAFVKALMQNALPDALVDTPGHYDTSLLQQVLIDDDPFHGKNPDLAEAQKYLEKLNEIDYGDQLNLIQNDQLTHLVSEIDDATVEFEVYDDWWDNRGQEFPWRENVERIMRKSSVPLRNFSIIPPEAKSSIDIAQGLGGATSGFVTEQLVEIKHNSSFFTNLSATQKRRLKMEMAIWESVGNADKSKFRAFMLESKLIMLFPQAKPMLTKTMGIPAPPKKYTMSNGKTVNANPSLKYAITKGQADEGILWNLFRYNFDPDFTDIDKVSLRKKFPKLAWGLTGKAYFSEFKSLVDGFAYPFHSKEYLASLGTNVGIDILGTLLLRGYIMRIMLLDSTFQSFLMCFRSRTRLKQIKAPALPQCAHSISTPTIYMPPWP